MTVMPASTSPRSQPRSVAHGPRRGGDPPGHGVNLATPGRPAAEPERRGGGAADWGYGRGRGGVGGHRRPGRGGPAAAPARGGPARAGGDGRPDLPGMCRPSTAGRGCAAGTGPGPRGSACRAPLVRRSWRCGRTAGSVSTWSGSTGSRTRASPTCCCTRTNARARRPGLATTWVRKEALLKASGDGPARSTRGRCAWTPTGRRWSSSGRRGVPRPDWVVDLELADGLVAALAGEGTPGPRTVSGASGRSGSASRLSQASKRPARSAPVAARRTRRTRRC